MATSKEKRKRIPKHVLKLPDLEQSKSAVLNSLTSRSSQRTYDHAVRGFIASTHNNLRLAAVRRLAYEAADCGLLSADLAAGIRRVRAQNGWKCPLAIGSVPNKASACC